MCIKQHAVPIPDKKNEALLKKTSPNLFTFEKKYYLCSAFEKAEIAQLVEQFIRNE